MGVEGEIRLAWQAARDGRPGMRDALLTLAVAGSGPDDAGWVERAWSRLVAGRPDHLFARFATLDEALAHPEVTARLGRIRAVFPPARVHRLLLRAEVIRGTYTGRRTSLATMIDELVTSDEPKPHVRPQPQASAAAPARPESPVASAGVSTAPRAPVPARTAENRPPLPSATAIGGVRDDSAETSSLAAFYLSILLGIAMLLAAVLSAKEQESKAA